MRVVILREVKAVGNETVVFRGGGESVSLSFLKHTILAAPTSHAILPAEISVLRATNGDTNGDLLK
jgi:hypothetical protein